MNGREYTEWQLEVSKQLSTISEKLDAFKEWTEKHDIARAVLVGRVESLEHSRTWFTGSVWTLWAIVSGAIAVWIKRFFT